jgi:hypothetical protein
MLTLGAAMPAIAPAHSSRGRPVASGIASASPTHAAISPADRAAVHAYLLDRYVYVQAITEAAPALVGAYEGAASRIAGECPAVLAGVHQGIEIVATSSTPPRTARQRGEEKRRTTQRNDLEAELGSELNIAEREPRQPAALAFLARLKALPKDDPGLTQIVHVEMVELEEGLQVEGTDVCADMKAWTDSGYRTLSPASRAIALKRETEFAGFLKEFAAQYASESQFVTGTPADKALVRKTELLEAQTTKTVAYSIESARKRVEVALGLETQAKVTKPVSHESKSSTEIGTGRTAAGTRYTVWLERNKGGSAFTCKLLVEVRGADGAKPGLLELIEDAPSGACLKPDKDRFEDPSVKCSEGLLTINAEVLSATRTVDLHMSNSTQIVSRPALVPRRLGGPAAFYYQVVRGPSPIPVSLTERDAQGSVLRVVKLQRIVGCSKHPLKYLPGGKRTLAHGHTPQGPDFSIVGERYRLFGRLYSQLKLRTGDGLVSSDEGEEEGPNEGEEEPSAAHLKRSKSLDSGVLAGCHPHEYSIFYGLLEQPRDMVLAKVAGKLVPVLRARVPSSLHAGGVLVYLASDSQPEEIIVRAPSGKLVMSEDLSRVSTEGRETCEGESEGTGPPPGDLDDVGETSRIVLSGQAPQTGPDRAQRR